MASHTVCREYRPLIFGRPDSERTIFSGARWNALQHPNSLNLHAIAAVAVSVDSNNLFVAPRRRKRPLWSSQSRDKARHKSLHTMAGSVVSRTALIGKPVSSHAVLPRVIAHSFSVDQILNAPFFREHAGTRSSTQTPSIFTPLPPWPFQWTQIICLSLRVAVSGRYGHLSLVTRPGTNHCTPWPDQP